MAGITFSIPNTFAGVAGPTEPLSALDADFAAIQTALSGLVAALTDLPSAVNATGTRAWAKGVDLASAAALNLGSDGNYFVVTGTTTITSISTKQAGCIIYLRFSGALTLTHDAAALILQGATNATTAAGDLYEFVSEGGGNWREVSRRVTTNATAAKFLSGVGTFLTPSGTALSLVGVNTTEGTSNSGADADLVTVTLTTSIAVGTPFIVLAALRKTTGAAAIAQVGLKLNATTVRSPQAFTDNANTTADGYAVYFVGPWAATNYTMPLAGMIATDRLTGFVPNPGGVAIPNATITSVIIRGNSGSASVTMGVQNVYVYALATS